MEKEYVVPEYTSKIHEEIDSILRRFSRKDKGEPKPMTLQEQRRLKELNMQLILAHLKHGRMNSEYAICAKRTIDLLK
jgi:hypothetical protein